MAGRLACWLPVAAGVLLHTWVVGGMAQGAPTGFRIGLFVWLCLPYALAWLIGRWRRRPVLMAGFAGGALAGDAYMHVAVFIAPKSSTAALGLLFIPAWNIALLGPLGLLAAWLVAWLLGRRQSAGRQLPPAG